MILRRIIAHFRKQEWTAIGIDFVIVVVGVFVGIQVANWNAEAADRRRGAEYVERLTRDMEADLVTRRGEAEYYAAVLASVVRTNELLADANADAQALVVSAYRASEITFSPTTRATWDEIVSSGDIGLLPGEASNGAVASYFVLDTSRFMYELLQASDYRRRVREIIPLEAQMALRAGCSDVRNEAQQWLVTSDDAGRRLVYAINDSPNYTYYSASAQVFDDGQGSRFVWSVDFLPDSMAGMQNAAMEAGVAAMARALA